MYMKLGVIERTEIHIRQGEFHRRKAQPIYFSHKLREEKLNCCSIYLVHIYRTFAAIWNHCKSNSFICRHACRTMNVEQGSIFITSPSFRVTLFRKNICPALRKQLLWIIC